MKNATTFYCAFFGLPNISYDVYDKKIKCPVNPVKKQLIKGIRGGGWLISNNSLKYMLRNFKV